MNFNIFYKLLVILLTIIIASCAGRSHPESMDNVKVGTLKDLMDATYNNTINPDDLKIKQVATELPLQEDIYKIGSNDVLNIIVLEHEELSSPRDFNKGIVGTIVKKDGYIYVPIVGRIKAKGFTVPQFIKKFKNHLAKFILNPEVSVDILQYKSQKFYILGSVRKPGVFSVDGDTTLLEGIAMAGGVPPEGNLERAYVIRDSTLLPINIADILLRGDTSRNIYMQDNDLVYIPSSADQTVYVLGEVKDPKAVKIVSNRLSLGQAIAEAGGLKPVEAKKNTIRVIRGNWQEPTIYTIKYDAILVYGDKIWLQPGDRVIVEPTGLTTLSRYMLQVLPFLIGVNHATSIYDRLKP